MPGEGESEEAGATVGVYKKAVSNGGLLSHVIDKGRENEGVVLEEVSCEEPEAEISDPLFDNFAWVGMNGPGGCAKKEGCSFLELSLGGSLLNTVTFSWQGFVDFVHCDGAMRNVDNPAARSHCQKPDVQVPVRAGFLEVRCDFGAVVPGLGRGNGVFYRMGNSCHVPEEFADLTTFPPELLQIVEMLILAATAGSKERTARVLPVGTGRDYFDQVGM